jgi:dTDP-4-dehydrorhamnose reductase
MIKKRVLILGARGMAGHIIRSFLNTFSDFDIKGTARCTEDDSLIDLDVTDLIKLKQVIRHHQPNYVINAVGVLINGSISNVANTIFINSYFPHRLLEICNEFGTKVIHLSTDCVFAGNDKGGYLDSFPPDAIDIYGRSKALGELLTGNSITIRTSIIGPELQNAKGEGLFHWFMNLSGKEIKGYTNVYWSGITTLELAKVILKLMNKENAYGLYQVSNGDKISKLNLLYIFNELWKKNKTIEPYETKLKDKSLIPSVKDIHFNIPSYRQMLLELKEHMSTSNVYYHYD